MWKQLYPELLGLVSLKQLLLQVLRRRRHFVERSVDAVADLEVVLEWFEMDVRGPFLDGLEEHQVHVADDGGRVRFRFQIVIGHAEAFQLGQDIGEIIRSFFRVVFVDEFQNSGRFRHDDADILIQGESKVLNRVWIQRISQRDVERGLVELDG